MALILSIETSNEGCSVALHSSGELKSNIELFEERSTAEMLTTMISNCLAHSNVTFNNLDAIAISKGPGSYTGLRIGVSTVKGLCFASDLPLISVNSLDSMIEQVRPFQAGMVLCPMLDARRMEVYSKIAKNEGVLLDTSAVVIDENSFKEFLEKEEVLFFGPGSSKCQSQLSHSNALFLDADIRPKAAGMGRLAFMKYEAGEFEDVAEFEPFYLKEFMGTKPTKNKKVVAQ
ncbi:tRNA (adenosine(37)-N6)-threonylcarbamoyltransferase complex dimerization subunit type 1 TsaB [Jiulongibacter sp. NS-SX5]|uniref:tRNA (adenosine(37)-N6)-threonylcarbamoyltransferase complex dimerization subunit type 1 TsaB n=1 Tax=Jiulongibacter sp. NS-SX5 TaxID=3463854 RepID=UPI004057F9E7